MKIVNTSNVPGDYPNESFINLPPLSKAAIETIALLINEECSGPEASRYWMVVSDDYQLAPSMADDFKKQINNLKHK